MEHLCAWLNNTDMVGQAEPLGGGQVLGSGRMWVSPAGEMDPRAVRVQLEGRNLPTESLLKRYLPKARGPLLLLALQHPVLHKLMQGTQKIYNMFFSAWG